MVFLSYFRAFVGVMFIDNTILLGPFGKWLDGTLSPFQRSTV